MGGAVIDFPNTPTIGAAYAFAGRRWIWNGYAWAETLNEGQGVAVFTRVGPLVQNAVPMPSPIGKDWVKIDYV